jgi:uncharacterized membrane protein
MRNRTKRVLLALVSLGLLLGVMRIGSASGVPANDFSVSVAETSATVVQGHETQFHITITRGTGFTAGVTLAVSGLPANSQGVWTPSQNTNNNRVLTVYTTTSTALGTFTLTFTAKGSNITHTTTAQLTVVAPAPTPGFTLASSPANLNVQAGTSGSFTITITRRLFALPISFSVTGLPPATTANFVPTSTTGNSVTLNIATSLSTPVGSTDLVVKGTGGTTSATTTAHLTVSAGQGQNFGLSGSADRLLAPGVSGFIDVAITNPNNQPLNVTNLTVTVTGTSKAACTTSNFSVTQFSGTYPITVPANATRTLSQLGIAQAQRPKVTMLNLPVNQDVCKNTGITLGFTGSGSGG